MTWRCRAESLIGRSYHIAPPTTHRISITSNNQLRDSQNSSNQLRRHIRPSRMDEFADMEAIMGFSSFGKQKREPDAPSANDHSASDANALPLGERKRAADALIDEEDTNIPK